MSDYDRSTHECISINQLRPELAAAIRTYLEKNDLATIESELIMCCETTSTKRRKGPLSGLFRGLMDGLLDSDSDPIHYTGALITPTWLIWARGGAKYSTAVSAARMSEIELSKIDLGLKEMNLPAVQDGLFVFGFINYSAERASAFIGLGPEPAAEKFRQVLQETIEKARH